MGNSYHSQTQLGDSKQNLKIGSFFLFLDELYTDIYTDMKHSYIYVYICVHIYIYSIVLQKSILFVFIEYLENLGASLRVEGEGDRD